MQLVGLKNHLGLVTFFFRKFRLNCLLEIAIDFKDMRIAL